jgi:hypothetical protein
LFFKNNEFYEKFPSGKFKLLQVVELTPGNKFVKICDENRKLRAIHLKKFEKIGYNNVPEDQIAQFTAPEPVYSYEIIPLETIEKCTPVPKKTGMVIDPETFTCYTQCSSDPEKPRWRECRKSVIKDLVWVAQGEKRYPLHRIIAQTFIPNPNNFHFVMLKEKKVLTLENIFWSKTNNISSG